MRLRPLVLTLTLAAVVPVPAAAAVVPAPAGETPVTADANAVARPPTDTHSQRPSPLYMVSSIPRWPWILAACGVFAVMAVLGLRRRA